MRYHAKEFLVTDGKWEFAFEEKECNLMATNVLLVRVLIAKVEDSGRLAHVFRNTPIRTREEGWNCVSYVRDALEKLATENKVLGTKIIDWQKVRDGAMQYCQHKRDNHRFDGQGQFDMSVAPTYDLLEAKETVP
jgi:hypothetical protein